MRYKTLSMKALFVLLLSSTVFCTTAVCLELAGVTLPDKITLGEQTLVLNGAGIRKATIFRVKVYVAGLYLNQKSSDPGEVTDSKEAKKLVMHFVRDVGADKLREGWSEGFRKNSKDLSSIQKEIATFNSWMDDIEEGQSIELLFSGEEVLVLFAGQNKGSIDGSAFQEALLRIWLGPQPPNEDLKQGLLGLVS